LLGGGEVEKQEMEMEMEISSPRTVRRLEGFQPCSQAYKTIFCPYTANNKEEAWE